MAIKTLRGFKKWLKDELDQALLDDDIQRDIEEKNGIPYDIDNDTIYQRICFFRTALNVIRFVLPEDTFEHTFNAFKIFVQRKPKLATDTVIEILNKKFPDVSWRQVGT